MPQVQFLNRIVYVWVVTQRQIPVQRVQKKIDILFLLRRFTGLRHGRVKILQLQIEQQHVEVPEIQTRDIWQRARRLRSIPGVRSPVVEGMSPTMVSRTRRGRVGGYAETSPVHRQDRRYDPEYGETQG